MKLALIIGINHYDHITGLHGCVNDAKSVEAMLARNENGSKNFDCRTLVSAAGGGGIARGVLKDAIEMLFSKKTEISLLYFSGHGHIEATGGYIMASDAHRGDEGVSMADILTYATNSPATNKVILLDCCHSGFVGNTAIQADTAVLTPGMTILTASGADEYATEENGSGLFTALLTDALAGGAANLIGNITPGSIYAHIDQSLDGWGQRPVFKTNVKNFVSLRQVTPPIALEVLRLISTYFPAAGYEYRLDPTYEPEMKGRSEGMAAPIEAHTKVFAVLQKYNRLNLLVPVGAPHMWHAAMEGKACKLTPLGDHYRRLVEKGLI